MTDQTARAEAERLWPNVHPKMFRLNAERAQKRGSFEAGAEWARAALLAEVREEVRKTLGQRKVKLFDGLAVLAVLDRAAGKTGADGG